MPIVIHKLDASPPARAALMTAELLKLNYTTEEVNVLAGDTRKPEFLEKNPMHTIPLLEDGDFILVDSHAIMSYLVSKYGADKRAELYPADLYLKSTIDQRMYFDATIVFPNIRATVAAVVFEKATETPEKIVKQAEDAYDILEKYLSKTKFVAANHLTIADVALVSSISTLNSLVPIDEKYEKVLAWWNVIKEQEWYKKANVPGLQIFTQLIQGTMEKNKSA